jgi:hypothetical protein
MLGNMFIKWQEHAKSLPTILVAAHFNLYLFALDNDQSTMDNQ